MKRMTGVVLMVIMALAFTACGTTQQPSNKDVGGMPEWVRKARRNAPEGTIVGIGSAKLATTNQSMNTSEARARAQIVRAMDSIVSSMIQDYTASSEIEPTAAMAFQEEITTTLARARLTGAVIEDQNVDENGTWWTVVYLSADNVVNEINQAQSAARLRVPAAHANLAENKMNERIREASQQEWADN